MVLESVSVILEGRCRSKLWLFPRALVVVLVALIVVKVQSCHLFWVVVVVDLCQVLWLLRGLQLSAQFEVSAANFAQPLFSPLSLLLLGIALLSSVDLVLVSQTDWPLAFALGRSSESVCYNPIDNVGLANNVLCQGRGSKNPIFRGERVASKGGSGGHPVRCVYFTATRDDERTVE